MDFLIEIAHWARRVGRRLYFPVHDRLIRTFMKLSPARSFIRERIVGDDPLRGSVCAAVYVHFDKGGVVHEYVVHQLSELVAAGYRITFVSNAPFFPAQSRARVKSLCKEVIWRSNIGYDFGAYKDGIASISDRGCLDSLILMNDSVYGPFHKLRGILEDIDRAAVDVWGITDSLEYRHHLQSYFMVFFPAAIRSQAFNKFWDDLPYVNHKLWVVRNAEVKLSVVLERAFLRTAVLCPYAKVAARIKDSLLSPSRSASKDREAPGFKRFHAAVMSGRLLNPAHFFWNTLIEDFQSPFIKRDLIQANPSRIPSAARWAEVIAASSTYDLTTIERHQLSGRNHSV